MIVIDELLNFSLVLSLSMIVEIPKTKFKLNRSLSLEKSREKKY
jgi:hypothetical protein